MIVVLINETVKKYLLKLPEDIKKKTRGKFEFLETGLWEGGLKVKKLKGSSSKCVFEARLDKGNRILFTLGRFDHPSTGKNLVIYVWGIVAHDNISKKSKTIIPANVPFLQFNDYNETLLENIEIEELEPSFFTQENITEKISDESGSQKWFPMDEHDWKRIQTYSKDDLELFLFLTPEQKKILNSSLPIMISGTAGSGKTTLSVYYLLNRALDKKKKVFITYNKHLKNFAQSLYYGLLIEQSWKDDVLTPEFYTFKELLLLIANNKRFKPENEVDFDRFSRLMSSYSFHNAYDPELVWEEIRSVIKGAVPRFNPNVLEKAYKEIKNGNLLPSTLRKLQDQFILFARLESFSDAAKSVQKYLKTDIHRFAANIKKYIDTERDNQPILAILEKTLHTLKKQEQKPGQNYLSFLQYELLGKKKAPNFQFNRKEIYRIFEWYQHKLETDNLWDELDLTSEVNTDKYSCDVLVCDEIQDFTDTQLDLLFNMVNNPEQMFLAGDTKQTINPSGFRWEDVRNHFYERGLVVPELKPLTLNFRSSGSIVELSNILLALKEKFTGKKAEEMKEDWKYKGRPVTVVSGLDKNGIMDVLGQAGARRTILVRNEMERDELKKRLDTELVFTITEAKGLEFDTVALWKFCGASASTDIWSNALELNDKHIHEAKIKHEINLLYVGITRSRRDLIIYDGEKPSLIWENDPIKDYVYITGDRRFIKGLWDTVSTPEEWIEQGHYFFERNYFKAAAECFKNGGDIRNTSRALAYYYEKTGRFAEAAPHFEIVKEKLKAAEYYEKTGDFRNAARLWSVLKNKTHTLLCDAEVLKIDGKHGEAGPLFLQVKDYQKAADCFTKAKEFNQAGDIYRKFLNNKKEALRFYEQGRNWAEAASLCADLKSHEKAAEFYFKAGKYSHAEKYWIKSKNYFRLKELYETTRQTDKILTIYEKEKNLAKCSKYLKSLNIEKPVLEKEAGNFLQNRKYFKAAVRYHAADNFSGTGKAYVGMKNYKEALAYFQKADDHYSAGECYFKLKKYKNSFMSYMCSIEDKEADFAMARKLMAKLYYDDIEEIGEFGKSLYDKGDYERAAVAFSRWRGFIPLKGVCYAMMGKNQMAIDTWHNINEWEALEEIADECVKNDLLEVGAEFILSGGSSPIFQSYNSIFQTDFETCFVLMDSYFKKNPDPVKMRTWGRMLAGITLHSGRYKEIFYYLEKSGDYNTLLRYLKEGKEPKKDREMSDTLNFEKDIPVLTARGDYAAAALRCFLLDKNDELNRNLSAIEINIDNYFLFCEGEPVYLQKAFDWAIQNNDMESMAKFFSYSREYGKAGSFFERAGILRNAAEYYKIDGQHEKACTMYENLGEYALSGFIYYDLKDYKRALEMFIKHGSSSEYWVALTYEKLKDYTSALAMWEKLKRPKDIARCKKRLEKQKGRRGTVFPTIAKFLEKRRRPQPLS